MGKALVAVVRYWVEADEISLWYVLRNLVDVCYQVYHVSEAWEPFSFEYQDEGELGLPQQFCCAHV